MIPSSVQILTKRVTGSTNDDLKQEALRGRDGITVLFADRQTAGKGRQGRSFFSRGGLYMSVLFPRLSGEVARYLTPCAAIAVAEAIGCVTGKPAAVKWVNDVYSDGKKVCGILAESVQTERGRAYVVGIGVNVGVREEDFPDELRGIAGSVEGDKVELAAGIVTGLLDLTERFDAGEVRRRYGDLLFLVGKRVEVESATGRAAATVTGLSDTLGLLVTYDDGRREELIAGDVHLILDGTK